MKKNYTKQLLTIIVALLCSIAASAHDFEVDGIFYNVSGDEAVVTYKGNSSGEYSGEYSGSVVIPSSVTYAGKSYAVTSIDRAFAGCSGLTSIVISNSVTSIGDFSFTGCTGLTSVTIGNSVTSIGEYAFNWCSSLASIVIPESVTSIKYGAFSSCSGLTSIVISNSVTSIGNCAFEFCTSLKDLRIEDGETILSLGYNVGVGSGLFFGCPLESVYLGRNIEYKTDTSVSTGKSPFSTSVKLKSVTIGSSVTSIGQGAFYGCSALTSITIPNSVTSIGYEAFCGCSSLTSIVIPNRVKSIGGRAFEHCSGLTGIEIPDSVTSIGYYAFEDCSGLTSIVVDEGNEVYDSRNNCNAIIKTATNKLVAGCKNTIIPESVTSIGAEAFWGCSGLTSIEIPNSVTNIERGVFCGCSGLTSLVIPKSVTSIGDIAFADCTSLKDLRIEDGDATLSLGYNTYSSSIGKGLFYDCPLESVYLGRNLTYETDSRYGYSPFYNKKELKSLTIGNSVTSIGNSAFDGCSGLSSVTSLETTAPTLGRTAFAGISSDATLRYPAGSDYSEWMQYFAKSEPFHTTVAKGTCGENLTWALTIDSTLTISGSGNMADYGSSDDTPWSNVRNSIKSVVVAEGVTSIGNWAFNSCPILTSITIPESVTSIGECALYKCSSLTNATIGNNVTSIGNLAFQYCKALTGIEIPSSVTFIGDAAFEHSGIVNIALPASLTNINAWMFNDCSSLTSVTIPKSVATMGRSAFEGCTGLTAVNISDLSAWCNIDFAPYSNPLNTGHNLYLNGELLTVLVIPESFTTIKAEVFNGCSSLKSVTIHENVTSIEQAAFCGCSSLVNITIPNNVTNIGVNAFYECTGLTSVTIPESVTSIENWAFSGCENLNEVISKATEAPVCGKGVFKGISPTANLTHPLGSDYSAWEQYFSTTAEIIAEGCHNSELKWELSSDGLLILSRTEEMHDTECLSFDDYKGMIKKVIINSGVTNIVDNLFSDCTNLTSVEIPNSVTSIGENAFSGCISLTSIVIPDGLKTIGYAAFFNCISLKDVTIGNGVTSMGHIAFHGCSNIKNVYIKDLSAWYKIDFDGGWAHPLNAGEGNIYLNGNLLTEVVIPDEVTELKSYAFYHCNSLTEVVIPNSVTNIGVSVFEGCKNLKNIVIPNSVTNIEGDAFSGCVRLTDVTIGNGVKIIGAGAFWGCGELENVYISDINAWFKIMFENGESNPLYYATNLYLNGDKLTEVVVPNDVTELKNNILGNVDIAALKLPENLESIEGNAIPSSVTKLVCNSATPPALDPNSESLTNQLDNIVYVYVPAGCKPAYDSWKNANRVIIDGSETTVDVTVTPGMMGEEILSQVNYLHEVYHLILKGSINSTDIDNIKNSMPYLLTIDMSGLDMTSIPAEMFKDKKTLLSVVLPKNVQSIGWAAFYGCSNITSIVLPEGLTTISDAGYYGPFEGCFQNCTSLKSVSFPSTIKSIGSYAFANTALKSVSIPGTLKDISQGVFKDCKSLQEVTFAEGVISLGDDNYSQSVVANNIPGVFEGCSNLKKVSLPEGLLNICRYTFNGCTSLESIIIPEGVESISEYAFKNCENLKSVTLPGTLQQCGTAPFAGCNKLDSIVCMALFPATLKDGLLTLDDMGAPLKRTLYVPEWTITKYKLASGWAAFYEILPLKGIYPDFINVWGNQVLSLPKDGLPVGYQTVMKISNYSDVNSDYNTPSSLNLRGEGKLSLSNFELQGVDYMGNAKWSMLLNDAEMEADIVSLNLGTNSGYWYFLSFPFDVKVSDIVTDGEWVIRKYDGDARAKGYYSDTWVTVPYDSVLRAGQGYIWASSGGNFEIKAVDNEKKNRIFANEALNVSLTDYIGNNSSDNSWNLVGNPYPCYYDTRQMSYSAPITVWNAGDNTYSAYSPVDDNYVLAPFEAFFVQKPAKTSSISFNAAGRQLSSEAVVKNNVRASQNVYSIGERRSIVNLTLSNDVYSDRTRFVINEDAKMDYEMECDAAKFMSTNASVPQLYTMVNDEKFAINERPMNDGVVKVGTYFAAAGNYTIAMQDESDMKVLLVDLKTGTETELNSGAYTFSAEVDDTERFVIRLYGGDVTNINAIEDDVKVSATSEGIVVVAANDANITVYNAAGSLVAEAYGRAENFAVAAGVYIVKINGAAHRVVVSK